MTERVIVITGATGGLAQAIIAQLPETDQLVLLGRNKEKLEQLYGHRPKTSCIALDIRDSSAIERSVAAIISQFGSVDVLINNAGFGLFRPFDAYTSQEISEMFAVNTLATMTFSRLFGVAMAERKNGHIITIASMAGKMATAKSSVYAATKFAVIGYSDALRLELAEAGVHVTTVNPGPIATGFFDTADPTGDYLKSVERFTLQADEVAQRIVAIIGQPVREVNLPWLLALAHKAYTVFPRVSDWLARRVFNWK